MNPVFPSIIEIKKHLSRIGMREFADFQIDDDETPQTTMEKDQVNPEPFITDAQSFLPTDETKITAQFQKILENNRVQSHS